MFYSVVAENGFGVFTEKDRIASVKEYLRKPEIVTFDSKQLAIEDAIERYNQCEEDFDSAYFGSALIKLDWIHFRGTIRKNNLMQ